MLRINSKYLGCIIIVFILNYTGSQHFLHENKRYKIYDRRVFNNYARCDIRIFGGDVKGGCEIL